MMSWARARALSNSGRTLIRVLIFSEKIRLHWVRSRGVELDL